MFSYLRQSAEEKKTGAMRHVGGPRANRSRFIFSKAMGSRRLWGHEGYGVTKAMGSRRLWGHEGYGVRPSFKPA